MAEVKAPVLAFAFCLLTSSFRAGAQPPSPAALVHIDAVVKDAKGRLVKDLIADDFSVVEDGVARPVESAKFVSADGRADSDGTILPVRTRDDERVEAGRDGTRLFAIFLDEYHVAKGEEADRARDAIARFIQDDLGPRDLAVVVKPLDSIISFRLTHDKSELLRAVAGFEGRRGDYTAKNDFERNYVESAPARADAVRSQIVTSALDALVNHIGTLQPGRKTLLVVSDGFARPGRRLDGLPTIESTARDANRRGVSIYAIDPRALAGAPADVDAPEHEALRILGSQTDGRLAFTPPDVQPALAASAFDASGYYVIAFAPAHPAELRSFHQVSLLVKRAGAAVHARQGYWDASPEDVLREIDIKRAANPPPPPQPMRHVSPLIHPWFGVSRAPAIRDAADPNHLMQVSFVWEPVPLVPGDRTRRGPADLVIVRATRQTDGALVYTGQVRAEGEPAAGTGVPTEVEFLAPPGRLLLQLEIQDADRNILDTDVRDVVVGGLTGPVEVGTPEVFRAASARDFRALKSEPEAVPASSRDFSRADHLLIRLPVYGDGVSVTAALTNKAGVTMRLLPAIRRAGSDLYETDLNLAGMATGDYAVKIAAKGQAGDAGETIAFRVVP